MWTLHGKYCIWIEININLSNANLNGTFPQCVQRYWYIHSAYFAEQESSGITWPPWYEFGYRYSCLVCIPAFCTLLVGTKPLQDRKITLCVHLNQHLMFIYMYQFKKHQETLSLISSPTWTSNHIRWCVGRNYLSITENGEWIGNYVSHSKVQLLIHSEIIDNPY